MTAREYASRDLHREVLTRTLETVRKDDFMEISLPMLKVTFDANEKTFDRISDLQAAILAQSVGAAEKIAARKWLQITEMDYKTIRMQLCERIAELEQANIRPRAQHEARPSSSVVLGAPDGLGTFDGTHGNWPAFRDLFVALVHSREYPNLSKLLYLKKACKGAAALALGGYDPLEDCYMDAWNGLKAIYNDDYAVAQALIDRMFDMPQAREEIGELRRIIDTTTSTLRQLASLGHQVEQWSALIVNLMTRKLPFRIVEQWEQKRKRGETPDLDDLIEFLEGKARVRLHGGENSQTKAKVRDGKQARPGVDRPYQGIKGRSGFNKRAMEGPQFRAVKSRLECRFCGGEHWLSNCADLKAKSIAEKSKILSRLGVCFNCLNFGHLKSSCGRFGCPKTACKGEKHHWILCPSQGLPANPHIRVAMGKDQKK